MKKKFVKFLHDLNVAEATKLLDVDISEYVEKITAKATIFSCIINGEIKAFIAFYENDPEGEIAYLTMLAVCPTVQGKGYGKSLLDLAINHLKNQNFRSFRLEVANTNLKAQRLYKRFGFQNAGEAREGYIFMKLDLGEKK